MKIKTVATITGVGLVFLLVWIFTIRATDNPVTDKNIRQLIKEKYHVYAVPLPDTMDFAGEHVPVHLPYVREKFDKELLINVYWQSNTLLYIKRSAKFFPAIEPVLKKYGIPDDFKYIALAESGLQHVTSPAGAKGIWQLMPKTARKYGLIVNQDIDERYHLEKSTEAACRYFLEAKEKFGNWTLTAAAYNRGMNGLEKALADQEERNYYKLYLNPETSRYIYLPDFGFKRNFASSGRIRFSCAQKRFVCAGAIQKGDDNGFAY